MNCDQVFTILTRGPFPSGESTDAAVEIHLSLCVECRHFAEALRPDETSCTETLYPEESRGLPYYWGVSALDEEQGTLVTTARDRRARRRRKTNLFDRREPLSHLSGWQLAFAVMMGAALGTVLRFLGYADVPGPLHAADARPTAVARASDPVELVPADAHRQLAAKLGVAPACWQDQQIGQREEMAGGPSSEFYSVSRNADLCCTKCHNATAPRFALRGTTARISRSCQVCHCDLPVGGYNPPQP
jgi:hypothetical protein